MDHIKFASDLGILAARYKFAASKPIQPKSKSESDNRFENTNRHVLFPTLTGLLGYRLGRLYHRINEDPDPFPHAEPIPPEYEYVA